MWTVNSLVNEAIQAASFTLGEFVELPEAEAKAVVARAEEKFVKGRPRVWWLSLKQKPIVVDADNEPGFPFLVNNWPKNEERCYFIPENEEPNMRVFDTTLSGVIKVIGETAFFEYNLVGKGFDWLMIETDHNLLLIVRDNVKTN